jgi:quercetin dioxygenase-like cupin family protein
LVITAIARLDRNGGKSAMEQLKIEDVKEFSMEKRIRKKLLGSDRIVAEFVCYEPGQATPEHVHPKQDEIFYVVEGTGIMIVNGEEISLKPTILILVKAREKHGVKTLPDSRLVLMFIKAPGSTKSVS